MTKHGVRSLVLLFLIVVNLCFVLSIQPSYNVKHISLVGFNQPEGIALGNSGEIYVSDTKNHLVKRIDSNSGAITIVAGTGAFGSDTNTNATSAKLYSPSGLAVTIDGKLLIADTSNHAIREVSNGIIRTIAGTVGISGTTKDNVNATSTNIFSPKYISTLSNGDIYFSEFLKIRKVSSGIITTQPISATQPNGLAVFSSTEMFISETDLHRLSRNVSGTSTTIGGVTADYIDGNTTNAKFNSPTGVAYGPSKEIYIADKMNHVIRMIEFVGMSGTVSVISGIAKSSGNDTLRLNSPVDVAVNSQKEVFILDSGNNRIRKLTPYCNSTYFYNVTLNECIPVCFGVVQGQADVCSGRGSCFTPDNCTCFNNTLWGGENCQFPMCKNILASNSSVCSGRGACIGTNNCTCQNSWGGQYCDIPKCANILANGNGVCSGRGSCIDANVCNCTNPQQYGGPNCEFPKCSNILANNNQVCNSNGQCIAPNNCSCEDGYSGRDCEQYSCYGVLKNSTLVCSGKGVCSSLNNCTCQTGFYGTNCQYYNCFGVRNDLKNVCSSVGNCSNVDTCNCTKNYYGRNCEIYDCYGKAVNSSNVCSSRGVCSSIDNCTCSQGYYGKECEKFDCFGVSSLNSTVCSSSGNCTQFNKCACKSGFYGSNCELFDCFGKSRLNASVCSSVGSCISPNICSCQLGYSGSNCETFNCSRAGNQTVCKNGNQCSATTGRCLCSDEWGGEKCDKVKCYSITFDNATVCSGHGGCSGYNNCTCDKDYYGLDCSLIKCYGILSNNTSVCSGKGICLRTNQCNCPNGFSGNECQYSICYGKIQTDPNVCSSKGQCVSPNNCKCSKDYVGKECELISVNMDIENALIYSYSDVLNNYLNDSVIDGCDKIIEKNEIAKLGQVELTKCQWRRNNFKLFLGYEHSITNGSIIKTQFGFSIRVDLSETGASFPAIMDLPEFIPSSQDLIIRSVIPSTYHHFKRISQYWTSPTSSVNSWLNNYSNKTVIRIPYSSILTGINTFDISLKSSNDMNSISSISKTIKLGESSLPSFNILTSREENCVGKNDCLFEIQSISVNSSLSFELFGGIRSELLNKQLFRIITNSTSSSNLKVTSTQTKTQSTVQLSYPFSIPTNIPTIDFRLTNVNRTYSLSLNKVTIGLESDDSFVKSLSPTSYSWYCYRTSLDKSNVIAQNLCNTQNSNQLQVDFNSMGLSEGMFMIGVNVTISENVYSYFGFIELVNSDISAPKITPDYIPTIYPSGSSLSLHCIVESDSAVVEYGWKLASGKLRNAIPSLGSFTSFKPLIENSFEIYLNIDSTYLIEGEWYEFELSVKNSVGSSKLSLSTRIDLKPRFTCSVDNLKNSDNTAYESLIAINCINLPQDRVSSIVMEIDTPQYDRLFIVSNTLKKTIVTSLPFYDGNLILRVKMVNEFGSISEFTKNLTMNLPERISWYSNNLVSRIDYVRDELTILKQSKSLTIDTINSLNALLSLIIQNGSLTQVSENILTLNGGTINKFVSLLVDMLVMMKDIPSLTYQVDEKVVQLIIPSLSNIFKLLNNVSNISTSSELEWWLNWIFTSMSNAGQYYSTSIFKTLLDSNHFEEIANLKTLLSNIYSNNATKQSEMARYHFEYYKLTRQSSSDGSIFSQVLPLVNQFNSKTFDISKNGINVKISFPNDFSTQIQTVGYNSIIFYALTMINNDTSNGNIMSNRPSLELSIFNKDSNLVKVDNLINPIIFKFEGLSTSNKTSINASCVYLDSSNNWSQSGIKTFLSITKRVGDLMYFDLECQVSHLSLFTIQELPYINSIIIPPNPPPTSQSSDMRQIDNTQQGTNDGVIAAAVIVPILGILIIVTIIVIVVLIIVWMMRKKKAADSSTNVANVKSGDIELVYDNLPSQAKYVKPTSAYSFKLDSAYISEVFNPHLRYTNIARIGSGRTFKVIDTVKTCPKTIKIVNYKSEDDLNKFLKEAVHLMNTNNPHISKINEMFISTEDPKLFIDMDYFEMGDFSKLTNRNFNLSENLIKQLIYQLCLALEFAHCTEKSIHGNIKTSNLLIKSLTTDAIESVITDFGLNCFENNIDPIFASPEMVSGYKYYFNTDIFSLGVVLYQIMTKDVVTSISELYGHKDQKEVVQVLRKTLGERYSEQVIELVLSMLEKDNLTRPQAQDILSNPMLSEFKKRK